jgi:predicted nucleic acid-binding protein
MQAIDTNILIYAEIESSERHGPAREVLKKLAVGTLPWAIPWPCIYEFLRVVTHPRVFHPPVPLDISLGRPAASLAFPFGRSAERNRPALSRDERNPSSGDFSRFTGLKVINPFASP